MRFSAEDQLSALLEAAPRPTVQAPRDARGLYGLVDHHGDLRYIGSTSSKEQTLYERIHDGKPDPEQPVSFLDQRRKFTVRHGGEVR